MEEEGWFQFPFHKANSIIPAGAIHDLGITFSSIELENNSRLLFHLDELSRRIIDAAAVSG